MNIMKNYKKALQLIYNDVGFKEDWVVYAIDDKTEMHWCTDKEEKEWVRFSKNKKEIINDTGNYFEDEIYTQRFYPKWVYRGKTYTLILVDTHTDGNKFFAVFDNTKEIK